MRSIPANQNSEPKAKLVIDASQEAASCYHKFFGIRGELGGSPLADMEGIWSLVALAFGRLKSPEKTADYMQWLRVGLHYG
jgi:hypothetical protein